MPLLRKQLIKSGASESVSACQCDTEAHRSGLERSTPKREGEEKPSGAMNKPNDANFGRGGATRSR